nr:cytochrome c oxidase subunit 2 [Eriocaulon australe]
MLTFLKIFPSDAAETWQLGFQDAATPIMQGIIDLHHDIFFFLILILVFVLWMLVRALWHFNEHTNQIPQRIVHGTTIEIIWTIFPSIILMFIAIPSFALLYSMDEVVVDPAITLKAIGHQWYWTYEYSDYNSSDEQSLTFDSYMIPEDDLELGQLRLLEVDNRVVVPAKTHLRMIVTPADVPHSWAVPSSGVKCDAVPGRSNQTSISVQREGVYYGQCSEIRGTNHAFMPIVVEAVPKNDYIAVVGNNIFEKLLLVAHSASNDSQVEVGEEVNQPSGGVAAPAPEIPYLPEEVTAPAEPFFIRNFGVEADILCRVNSMERRGLFLCPPQTSQGEYFDEVLDQLNDAQNLDDYLQILSKETHQVCVWERVENIQLCLQELFQHDPRISPLQMNIINPYLSEKAHEFILEKLFSFDMEGIGYFPYHFGYNTMARNALLDKLNFLQLFINHYGSNSIEYQFFFSYMSECFAMGYFF